MSKVVDGGIVTAYGAAVRGGYQGTYEQFCADLANLAQVLEDLTGMSVTVTTLAEGSQATGSYADGILSLGIPKGDTGNGISSMVLNQDYTLTVNYTDGTSWTSGSIRGETGATPNLSIGTVSTLTPGSQATAQITGTAENPVLNLGIPQGAPGELTAASMAPVYSASSTYAVGDYVIHDGQLYRCTTAITTAEAWTAAHWTAAKVAEDVSDLNRQTSELKSAFDVETTEPSINLLDASQIETGCYYWTDGRHDSSDYNATPMIAVTSGDTIYLQTGYENAASRSNKYMRFVTGYDANKAVITTAAKANVISYTVPDGVYYIIASVAVNILAARQFPVLLVSDTGTVLDYIPYYPGEKKLVLKAESNNDPHIREIAEQVVNSGKAIFTVSAASLAANTNLICCDSCDNKKNEYIELTANFTSFGELTIAHGKGSYMGMYIIITSDKIQIYNYDGTLTEEYDHGLTLSDFINVIIYTKNDDSCRSKISIMSAGGDYDVETSRYYSCRAAVLCNATFAMTNVEMRYTVNDAKADVWVFGDSYISLGDPNRWPTQMVSNGHKNVLLCGFGGAMSANEIISFRALMAVARPKFVVWALGMNDGDSSTAVNANWKTYVDEVIASCEEKGVTPILATIPNVPNVINTFKNDYVKSLDYRYVDFAKAVNAESTGATWYTGMLSSDNTHPTALGAKALMRQFLLDVPEVLYEEANI